MKTTRQGILVLMALILFAAMATAEPITIDNGSTPSDGVETIKLKEMWRAGGDEDDDYFGVVSQVLMGKDGNIYLLDTRLSEVPVYSPEGERLTTLSREGDGPGETRIPSNMLFMPDGTLGLVQVFPGKVTKIDTDGDPQGIFEINGALEGGFMMFYECLTLGDNLVIGGVLISQAPPAGQVRHNFVSSYDAEGNELIKFYGNDEHWDFTKFTYDENKANVVDFRKVVVGNDDRVYMATRRNEYTINVYLPDGTHERTITREFKQRKRTGEERDEVQSTMEMQFGQIPNATIIAADTHPVLGGLQIGPKGNLWVTTSRSGVDQAEGIVVTWDIFNPDGKFIKQVSLAGEGDGEQDAFFPVKGGGFVQVTGFTDAIQALQGGQGGSDEEVDEDAEPMKVIFYKAS